MEQMWAKLQAACEAREGLLFSAWLNTLRDAAERYEEERREANSKWRKVVEESGAGRWIC